MDNTAVYERLVAAGDAIDLLAREYDRREDYANFDVCKRVALSALLTRLKNSHLDAWSGRSEIDSTIDNGSTSFGEIISKWDFHRYSGVPAKVPDEFWMHFHNAGEQNRSFDSITGDFKFEYTDETYSSRDGIAFAVYFDTRGLPACSVPTWHGGNDLNSKSPLEPIPAPRTGKGRPPANWWAVFSEELAFYIHTNGLPETQEALIAGVFSGLAEREQPEPSRTQIQPVISRLFKRLASAGK